MTRSGGHESFQRTQGHPALRPLGRANHWIVAICFVLLTLSGLALFYPAFFGLTALFGGPEPTRIVHPYIGVFMTLFFLIQAVRFFRANLFRRYDVQWARQIGDVLSNRDERLPRWGRTTPGRSWCTGYSWPRYQCCW